MKLNEIIVESTKQRLDPKCWTGYKKQGTKMKGGTRVNNCVPNESVEEAANPAQQAAIAIAKKKKDSVAEGYYDLNDEGMQPIDLSANPSFKQIVNRYTQLFYQGHEGSYDDEESAESDAIEQYVAKRFGQKGSDHLMRAANASYGGRDDGRGSGAFRSSNLGGASKPVGNFRTTKAGKMHSQDAKMMKAKVADRLGRHPEPALPEGVAESEQRMSRAAKGNEKYGKDGMKALAKAGREGASEKKLDAIRDKHDKYDDKVDEGMDELAIIQKLSGVALTEDLTLDEQFDVIEEMVQELAEEHNVDAETIWEDFDSVDDDELYETAAWRRKEGKSKSGGLNAKGVASYRRENPGSKLQTAVTTKPSKLKPGSKAAKRRKSFCARMGGMKGAMKKDGKPTRKALALRKWNC